MCGGMTAAEFLDILAVRVLESEDEMSKMSTMKKREVQNYMKSGRKERSRNDWGGWPDVQVLRSDDVLDDAVDFS